MLHAQTVILFSNPCLLHFWVVWNGSISGKILYHHIMILLILRLTELSLEKYFTGWVQIFWMIKQPGSDRFFREAAVAVITPTRFFSRLLHGKLTRLTPEEVYQKEPLNITLSGGYHKVNEGRKIENRNQQL